MAELTGAKRTGPRPLPVHLATALGTWMNSCAVSPIWKNGSLPSNPNAPHLTARSVELRRRLEAVPTEAFSRAVAHAAAERHRNLIDAILRYRHHDYRRDVVDPPAVWQAGTTRVLDYGQVPEASDPDGPRLLCIPSLINRAYILDLKSDTSFLRYLAAGGYRPLLVDWGWPGAAEYAADLTGYVAGKLEAALDFACDLAGEPVPVLGYCMGGTLAVALAQRRPREAAALVLLAAPWDFHAEQPARAALVSETGRMLEPLLQAHGALPVDMIQMLFNGLDPQTSVRKFLGFGRMQPESARAEAFVALEDWLNDGVPLPAAVARACLREWYGGNAPARGEWRIAGRPVDPAEVRCPSLVVAPAGDRIVPPGAATPLGSVMPTSTTWTPSAGHIGMVTSRRARSEIWAPLLTWLNARVVQRT